MKLLTVSHTVNALDLFLSLDAVQAMKSKPALCIVDGLGPVLNSLRAGSTHHHQGKICNHAKQTV